MLRPTRNVDQEHEHDRQPRERHVGHERPGALARPEARPQHPHEQVEQHRVHQRHRRLDLAAVEEHVRDAEAEQHEQVEVQQAKRPPEVDERDQEQQAQRDPHVRGVELAPERARVAARHAPGHLVPRPLLVIRPVRSSTST